MEAAAIFTLASLYGFRSGSVCTAIANRITDKLEFVGMEKCIKVANLAISILYERDQAKVRLWEKPLVPLAPEITEGFCLKIRPVAYALGAEITGVDLSNPLGERAINEIRKAWLEHIVLYFPEQDLHEGQLCAFAAQFGELDDNRALPHLRHPEIPAIYVIVNKPVTIKQKYYSGGAASQWHTDLSYTLRPGTGGFLMAKELPDVGGNTIFANMYLAYETLSPTLQRMIEPLEGVHDVTTGATYPDDPPEVQAEKRRLNPPIAHPVVRTHPESGRKALYLGENVRTFVGMAEDESRPIIDMLNRHATRYELVYRHTWRVNDLVMWDNRCALHYAVRDYDPIQLGRMMRCSLLGPKTGYVYDPSLVSAGGSNGARSSQPS